MGPEAVLSELIGQIYEAAIEPAKWEAFLKRAAELFGSHTANIHFQDTSSLAVASVLNMDPVFMDAYRDHFGAMNPFMKRTDVQQEGRAYVRRELIDTESLVRTEFYNDWARPQGFHDFVCGTMVRRGPMAGNITFWRRATADPCDEQEIRTLQLLMPHLVRAMQIHRKLAGLERKCEALCNATEAMHQGLVIVDVASKVVTANAAAQRLIGANDGVRVRHGKLETDSPSNTAALRQAIKCAVSCVTGRLASVPDLVIVNRHSRGKLVIWIAPISSGAFCGEQDPLVAVFVVDPEAASRSPEKLLRKLFGLTPAESRLANALMKGDLTSASEEFGISRNTARSQLQSIFSKTGTSKQGELIRLLCQLGCMGEQG